MAARAFAADIAIANQIIFTWSRPRARLVEGPIHVLLQDSGNISKARLWHAT
jgi:hypothetical protein